MKQLILTQFPWPWLPATALVIFFAFFVLMVVRLGRKKHQPLLYAASQIPLDEGERHE